MNNTSPFQPITTYKRRKSSSLSDPIQPSASASASPFSSPPSTFSRNWSWTTTSTPPKTPAGGSTSHLELIGSGQGPLRLLDSSPSNSRSEIATLRKILSSSRKKRKAVDTTSVKCINLSARSSSGEDTDDEITTALTNLEDSSGSEDTDDEITTALTKLDDSSGSEDTDDEITTALTKLDDSSGSEDTDDEITTALTKLDDSSGSEDTDDEITTALTKINEVSNVSYVPVLGSSSSSALARHLSNSSALEQSSGEIVVKMPGCTIDDFSDIGSSSSEVDRPSAVGTSFRPICRTSLRSRRISSNSSVLEQSSGEISDFSDIGSTSSEVDRPSAARTSFGSIDRTSLRSRRIPRSMVGTGITHPSSVQLLSSTTSAAFLNKFVEIDLFKPFFVNWRKCLFCGLNILLLGIANKKCILKEFSKPLLDRNKQSLYINGNYDQYAVSSSKKNSCEDLLHWLDRLASAQLLCDFLDKSELSLQTVREKLVRCSELKRGRIILLIEGIDMLYRRNELIQKLGLEKMPNVSIIASADHPAVHLLWKERGIFWVKYDVSTFNPSTEVPNSEVFKSEQSKTKRITDNLGVLSNKQLTLLCNISRFFVESKKEFLSFEEIHKLSRSDRNLPPSESFASQSLIQLSRNGFLRCLNGRAGQSSAIYTLSPTSRLLSRKGLLKPPLNENPTV